MEINATTILIVIAGVVIGWILSSIKSFFTVRKYKKELKDYQEHLNRQMKIVDEGNKNRENELASLKMENENLRISVKTLGQKPGRGEIKLLNIYDSALRKMMYQAPGFSTAWESALQEAEAEYEASEKGFTSIIKKVFVPSIMQRNEQKEIEQSDTL
jgi:uncharacterized protein YneF (UPF0154 family)